MRRAAVSVPANIAEGFKRRGEKDKIHFYNISQGSLSELDYYVILAKDLGFRLSLENLDSLINETGKMLRAVVISLEQKPTY